nr:diacylglycerol kinase family lipid kinase [Actinomycetota bacterium]
VKSDKPCHAKALAQEAVGYDSIVAVGGDGTVHEVLNGIMERAEDDRPSLSIIPTGSGNDYCRTLGISFDLPTAIRQIASGTTHMMDVGVVNGTYFANSIAVGLDARVTAKAVEMKVTTGWSGLPLYLRAVVNVLLHQFYSHEVTLQFDEEPAVDYEMLLLAATNGATYGGGFRVTPEAVSDDGVLDVCILDRVSLPGAFMRLPFLIVGKHTHMKPIHMSRRTHIRIESDRLIAGQVDGEVMLESTYDISILHKALKTIVPGE